MRGQAVDALDKIARINATLTELEEEMQQINDNERDLEFEVSEHPMLKECKDEVGPFEDFWALIKTYADESTGWKQGKFKEMDPEKIQKDHKTFMTTQLKLVARFKEKKLPKIEGLLKGIKAELIEDQKKHLPLINSFCNPGLKKRHWDKINDLLHADGTLGPEDASVVNVQNRGVGSDDPKILQRLDEIAE